MSRCWGKHPPPVALLRDKDRVYAFSPYMQFNGSCVCNLVTVDGGVTPPPPPNMSSCSELSVYSD